MIVNIEQRRLKNQFGQFVRYPDGTYVPELVVSYVGTDRKIKEMHYPIPQEQMFNWQYDNSRGKIHADPDWKSWDNKPVRKETTNRLSNYRLSELLNSFGDAIAPIYEFNLPETWFCDIETGVDEEEGMSKPERPITPVWTIAMTKFPQTIVWGLKPLTQQEIDIIQKKFRDHSSPIVQQFQFEYRYFPNEADMLMDFFLFVRDVSALTGWNFLGYDWLYLMNRWKKFGSEDDIAFLSPTGRFYDYKVSNKFGTRSVRLPYHKIIYDYLMVYEKWDQTVKIKENNSLDFVSDKVLGYKKVVHKLSFKDFYEQDYLNYVFYNSIDTILVEQIDKKIHTANIWYSMGSILHTELMSTFSTIAPAEIVMVNELYGEHKVLIEKGKVTEEDSSFVGAFVWPSQPGIYKFIGGLDFASLYPTTIRQFNFSPETYKFTDTKGTYKPKDGEIKSCYGAVYDNTYQGIVPRICEKYYMQRKQSKNLKKQATKDYEYLKQILDRRRGK